MKTAITMTSATTTATTIPAIVASLLPLSSDVLLSPVCSKHNSKQWKSTNIQYWLYRLMNDIPLTPKSFTYEILPSRQLHILNI